MTANIISRRMESNEDTNELSVQGIHFRCSMYCFWTYFGRLFVTIQCRVLESRIGMGMTSYMAIASISAIGSLMTSSFCVANA